MKSFAPHPATTPGQGIDHFEAEMGNLTGVLFFGSRDFISPRIGNSPPLEVTLGRIQAADEGPRGSERTGS